MVMLTSLYYIPLSCIWKFKRQIQVFLFEIGYHSVGSLLSGLLQAFLKRSALALWENLRNNVTILQYKARTLCITHAMRLCERPEDGG